MLKFVLPNDTATYAELSKEVILKGQRGFLPETPLSNQQPSEMYVNSSGVYALITGSRKAEAKAFQRWVTSEVLPAIRKNGCYGIANDTQIHVPTKSNVDLLKTSSRI